jgi:hypothetical protein
MPCPFIWLRGTNAKSISRDGKKEKKEKTLMGGHRLSVTTVTLGFRLFFILLQINLLTYGRAKLSRWCHQSFAIPPALALCLTDTRTLSTSFPQALDLSGKQKLHVFEQVYHESTSL